MRYLVFAALAALGLASCAGGASSPVAPVSLPTGTPAANVAPAGATVPYGANALQGATLTGRAKYAALGIDLYLAMRDQPGLLAYARSVADPTSANYRRFLSPQELGDRYGASQVDYDRAVRTLTGLGIAVKRYPQRQMLRVNGPQAALERFLGTTFGVYRNGRTRFIAPMQPPRAPAGIALTAVRATLAFPRTRRHFVPVRGVHGITAGYAPQQVAAAFDYSGAYNAGYTGKGIAVGVIGTGPITDGDARIGGMGDVAYFRNLFGIRGSGTVAQVAAVDSNVSPGNPTTPGAGYSTGLSTPPPVTSESAAGCTLQGYDPSQPPSATISDYTTCNPEDEEAQLDTEQLAGLAPDANLLFYIAYNKAECFKSGTYAPGGDCGYADSGGAEITATQELGLNLADDEIQQAIGDNAVDVLSLSFGGDEPTSLGVFFDQNGNGFGPTEFASLASEGIAVFASTGDNGAQACVLDTSLPAGFDANSRCVSYPATDPNVTAVGGTNAPIDQRGRLAGPLTVWGEQTEDPNVFPGAGGGGGISLVFATPPYQQGVPGVSGGKRNVPDIAGIADLASGVQVVLDAPFGAVTGAIGGTSVAAPDAAAMWALVLQACRQTAACATAGGAHPYRLGNPNAVFYGIYGGKAKLPYPQTFYDVLFGNNGGVFSPPGATPAPGATAYPTYAPGFTAGAGYDNATGIGVPFGRNLIRAVVGV